ncbi:hypothetical protein AAEX28_12960 [Lentisphaerota bacterium WC36G]|nr:hypothetical protein LJT99_15780 [Lentisphaerae bacterium WC36]
MNSYTDLIGQVIFDMPECTKNSALLALRQAGRAFCKETNVWTENLKTTTNFDIEKLEYDIDAVGESFIQHITALQINNEDVPKKYFQLTDDWSFEFSDDFATENSHYDGEEITVQVVVRPRFDASILSHNFLERYADPIIAKARSILLMQNTKPFFNSELAKEQQNIYNDYVQSCCLSVCSEDADEMRVQQFGNCW